MSLYLKKKKPGNFRMNILTTRFHDLPLHVTDLTYFLLSTVDCRPLNFNDVMSIWIYRRLFFRILFSPNSSENLFFKYILDICVCRIVVLYLYCILFGFRIGHNPPGNRFKTKRDDILHVRANRIRKVK